MEQKAPHGLAFFETPQKDLLCFEYWNANCAVLPEPSLENLCFCNENEHLWAFASVFACSPRGLLAFSDSAILIEDHVKAFSWQLLENLFWV